MKRSEINTIIEDAISFFNTLNFYLPPFAYYSIGDWQRVKNDAQEIFDLGLGWDVTDFGSGKFNECGLLLFTIRNGIFNSQTYTKAYAEKIMIAQPEQITPFHFHWDKMEDIINRGGGDLVFELYNATEDEKLAATPVNFVQDGIKKTVNPGEEITLKPGESLTLPAYLYHKFYGRNSQVMIGEVSMVNDDNTDNRFLDAPRFPEIEEDEPPKYLLCNDYQKILNV